MTSCVSVVAAACMLLSLSACVAIAPRTQPDPHAQYMAALNSLCGQRFEGAMTYPPDPKHAFANKVLVANFAKCSDTEVRIPLLVGEDASRTWAITRTAAGLDLRHDHRHADGSPDAETMYGGMAKGAGSPLSQSFLADDYTGQLIKGARTNVWTISVSPDKNTLIYHLDRDAKSRFEAVFKRVAK